MPKRTRSETAKARREEEEDAAPQEAQEEETTPKQKKKPKQPKTEPKPPQTKSQNEDLTTFQIPFKKDKSIHCETRQAPQSSYSLIFTHGAGGGLESAAMRSFATGFARQESITSFQGNMNLTSRVRMFRAAVEHQQQRGKGGLVLGGRSMGARAAVLTALELLAEGPEVQALVLVSYPLTASKNGRQEREFERREKILLGLPEGVDVLFISGTRDGMCELGELGEVRRQMKARSWMVQVRGADHGMGLTPKVGTQEVGEMTGEVAARWLGERSEARTACEIHWSTEEEKPSSGEWTEASNEVAAESPAVDREEKTG